MEETPYRRPKVPEAHELLLVGDCLKDMAIIKFALVVITWKQIRDTEILKYSFFKKKQLIKASESLQIQVI